MSFEKHYGDLLYPLAVSEYFNKYRSVERVNNEFLKTPQALEYRDNVIVFEYIDLSCYTELSLQIVEGAHDPGLFEHVGVALAQLHKNCGGYRHGDLWPGNIFTRGEQILFLDLEPPKYVSGVQDYLFGYLEQDLGQLIATLVLTHVKFSFTRPLKIFVGWKKEKECLIKGLGDRCNLALVERAYHAEIALYKKNVIDSLRLHARLYKSMYLKAVLIRNRNMFNH